MHDKLKLLLEQVNMPVELYSDFKDGNLDRINVNKKDNSVKFLITLDKILPVDISIQAIKKERTVAS